MSNPTRDNPNPSDGETLRAVDAALAAHLKGAPADPTTPQGFYAALAGSAPTAPDRFRRDLRSRLLDAYADPAALPGDAGAAPPAEDESLHWTRPPLPATPRRVPAQTPRQPARHWPVPRRAVSLAAGLAGVVLLLVLGGVTWLTFSRLAQQQEKPLPGTPTTLSATAASTAEAVETAQPAEDNTFLFSIPVGEGGIMYGDKVLSGFFAAAPDGTFWAGSADSRLLRYSGEGDLLGAIDIPSNEGYPSDMVTDGTDLWLLYIPRSSSTGPMTLYRVSPDGRTLAEFAFQINGGMNLSGLILGEHGEVFLKGNFYGVTLAPPPTLTAVAPIVPIVPPPVPSVVPETWPKPLLQLVDAQGNFAPGGLDGYPYNGKLYSARLGPGWGVLVKAGDVEVTIPLVNGPFSIGIAAVEPDGSFYVDVAEEEDTGGPYMRVYHTIYHYAADGRLIERARLPEMGSKLLTGPDGNFYVLMEKPPWTERSGTPPNSVDVYRLNFYPAEQPLPVTPTALTTIPVWTPVPTSTPESTLTTETTLDLDVVIHKSDVIAQVRVFSYNEDGPDAVLGLEVQQWLKNSPGTDAKTLFLRVPADLWPQMPPWFLDTRDPKSNYDQHDTYIMFLSKGPSDPTYGQTYYLTGSRQGAFLVLNGEIYDSEFPQYNGMSLEAFRRLITGEPTPVPPVPAEITPTRAPNSPPVALSREGDGYRLDVYEGAARFGWTPWIGPSRLLVEWTSASPPATFTYSTHIVDTSSGTMTTLPDGLPEGQLSVVPSPDGNRAVMVWDGIRLHVALYDFSTGTLETIADLDPSVPQWAGQEIGLSGIKPGGEAFVSALPVWAGNDAFALTVMFDNSAVGNNLPQNYGKVLLVDIAQRNVRVLAERGVVAAAFPDGAVLFRPGWIDGEIQLVRPGEKSPTTVASSGLWTRNWSVSPDGNRAAWLDMNPPPGDWSTSLPHECCSGDPHPVVKAIAVWDNAAGGLRHYDTLESAVTGAFVLTWGKDSTALYYSTHPTLERTMLVRLSLDGQTTPVVETARGADLGLIAEANDGSIYFMVYEVGCQFCLELMRLYPDGRQEVVQSGTLPTDWAIDPNGYLEVLKDGGVAVTDLVTGHVSQVNFPGVTVTRDESMPSMLNTLAPISPDGRWIAYTKPPNYAAPPALDGRPDYGRTVYIVRVK